LKPVRNMKLQVTAVRYLRYFGDDDTMEKTELLNGRRREDWRYKPALYS